MSMIAYCSPHVHGRLLITVKNILDLQLNKNMLEQATKFDEIYFYGIIGDAWLEFII